MTTKSHSFNTYMLLTLTALLWAGNPVAVKTILVEMPPLLIVSLRFLGISLLLASWLYFTEGRNALPAARTHVILALMGASGIAMNNGLQFAGLQYSTAINCTLFSATNPALTAILAFLVLRETLRGRQYFGIAVSLFGVLFLISRGSWEVVTHFEANTGDLLFFFSQTGWAVYSLLGRRVMTALSPLATTAWAGFYGALFTSLIFLFSAPAALSPLSAKGWISMLYMITGSGVLAFSWWNVGVARVGPHRATIFTNLIPLAGMFLAVLFLDETLTWPALFGGACILTGVYLTTSQPR